jgi:hypothetical protein
MDVLTPAGASIALYLILFLVCAGFAALAQVYGRAAKPVALTQTLTLNRRPGRVFWLLSFMVPFLLAALRWQVGTDYGTYVFLYTDINSIHTFGRFLAQLPVTEPAFILLNFFAKAVFGHYQFVFAVSALIITAFFYRAMEDYYEKCSVMIMAIVFLALLFGTSLNIVRQMIAVAIVFYATRYVFMRRYGAAAAFLAVAALFHYTALIVIPFWIFRQQTKKHQTLRILMFSFIMLLVVAGVVFGPVLARLRAMYIPGVIPQQASLGVGLILMRAPIFVPVLWFRKRLIAHDERNYLWIVFMIFELAFSHLGYIFEVFNRIALYFAVSWVVLLPSLIRCMPTRAAQYRMGAYVLFAVTCIWVFNIAINNFGDVLPYKTIFEAPAL